MGLFNRVFKNKQSARDEVILELAREAVSCSAECAKCVQEVVEMVGRSSASEDAKFVTAEYCLFFLHVTQRCALPILGSARYVAFMTDVATRTVDSLTQAMTGDAQYGPTRIRLSEKLAEASRIREAVYGRCGQIVGNPPAESHRGTVIWELGKVVAATVGANDDPHVIAGAAALAAKMIEAVNIVEILRKVDA